jgi:hypothetical protein
MLKINIHFFCLFDNHKCILAFFFFGNDVLEMKQAKKKIKEKYKNDVLTFLPFLFLILTVQCILYTNKEQHWTVTVVFICYINTSILKVMAFF